MKGHSAATEVMVSLALERMTSGYSHSVEYARMLHQLARVPQAELLEEAGRLVSLAAEVSASCGAEVGATRGIGAKAEARPLARAILEALKGRCAPSDQEERPERHLALL